MNNQTYFISYTTRTENDRKWAVWIEYVLRKIIGGKTIMQEYDFRPGDDFMALMDDALKKADVVVCILTRSYMESAYCRKEWVNAERFIPVKCDDCKPTGLLKSIIHINIHGLDENAALEAIVTGLQEKTRPEKMPEFPLTFSKSVTDRPEFPSTSIKADFDEIDMLDRLKDSGTIVNTTPHLSDSSYTAKDIPYKEVRRKTSRSPKIVVAMVLSLAFVLFTAITLYGNNVMAHEKEERYYKEVYEIEYGTDPQSAYVSALEMFWNRIDPYRAMAKRLWNDGDIDACRRYIEQNLGSISQFQSKPEAERNFGDIYFILGNCYYYKLDEPDYNKAKDNFEIAVRYVKDNPIYYRDYAISLAKTGNIPAAKLVLETAKSLHLEADSLNLLYGEIYYLEGDYPNAIDSFSKAISLTNDDYLRYRAYHTLDEIFIILGQPERSVALLLDALNRIPFNRVPEITERLANAYIKCGDYKNAVPLFEQLMDMSAPNFHIMYNLAISLQITGEFKYAASVLDQMADIFPGDYRIPMRQAYLEAEIQSKIANESREYTLTKKYYDIAFKLYNENLRSGESDPEMQYLDSMIEELRANGWID